MRYDYIYILNTHDDYVASNFSQRIRTNITNCLKAGLICKPLAVSEEIQKLYNILSENLKKYNVQPVHSFKELMELKEIRIPDNISFFGGYIKDELIAGAVIFYFPRTKTIHTQYLCSKEEFSKLSPMSFMYYSIILEAKRINYKKISWGVSTEDFGNTLNQGLLKNKESYGSTYSVNKTFYKEL